MFVCRFSSVGAEFHTSAGAYFHTCFTVLSRALASCCLCLVFALGAGSFNCNLRSLFNFMFAALSFVWRA